MFFLPDPYRDLLNLFYLECMPAFFPLARLLLRMTKRIFVRFFFPALGVAFCSAPQPRTSGIICVRMYDGGRGLPVPRTDSAVRLAAEL